MSKDILFCPFGKNYREQGEFYVPRFGTYISKRETYVPKFGMYVPRFGI